jgi:hypothetical protein
MGRNGRSRRLPPNWESSRLPSLVCRSLVRTKAKLLISRKSLRLALRPVAATQGPSHEARSWTQYGASRQTPSAPNFHSYTIRRLIKESAHKERLGKCEFETVLRIDPGQSLA